MILILHTLGLIVGILGITVSFIRGEFLLTFLFVCYAVGCIVVVIILSTIQQRKLLTRREGDTHA